MARDDYKVVVTVQESTATKTAAGSKTYTWATRGGQAGVTCWGPFQRSPANVNVRSEGGPGVLTVTGQFFDFRKPHPAVSRGNRIVVTSPASKVQTYEVLHPPRAYARTYQVDVEVVT